MASALSSGTAPQRVTAYVAFTTDLALGGVSQGILGVAPDDVWGQGIAGTATNAAVDVLTTPSPTLSLTGAVADAAAEGLAGPIGSGKLAIDGLIFLGSAAYCAAK
jgi:hypothetical protein